MAPPTMFLFSEAKQSTGDIIEMFVSLWTPSIKDILKKVKVGLWPSKKIVLFASVKAI